MSNFSRILAALTLTRLPLSSSTCADDSASDNNDDSSSASGDSGDEATDFLHVDDCGGDPVQGVTDDTITVGTVTDKGGPVKGLDEEMYDTAVAFTEWCNEHGGILGRELVLSDVDAKLFEYEPAITDAVATSPSRVLGARRSPVVATARPPLALCFERC